MTDEKLKPCPFCGSELSGLERGAFGHETGSPDCILSYTAFDAHDIERWNTRAAIESLSPKGQGEDALREALEEAGCPPLFNPTESR